MKPWELDKLSMRQRQHIVVAEKAEAYIREQQREQQDSDRGMRSKRGTKSQREFYQKYGSD